MVNEAKYAKYLKGKSVIGRLDGQFVISSVRMDEAIAETGADPVALGEKLGIDFKPGDKLYRVDIQDPISLNPRTPTSNLSGANESFVPGGKTSGGVPEVVIDPIPSSQFNIYPIN